MSACTRCNHGVEKSAETLLEEPVMREAIVTSDIRTEWITYRQLLTNKLERVS